MNTVWEVEKPINIWHDSWICLHNWCRNLNWIIIASWWTCSSQSHYIPPRTTPHDTALKSKFSLLHYNICLCVYEHGHAHAQMGADRQSMCSQGVTDVACWWTHRLEYGSAFDWHLFSPQFKAVIIGKWHLLFIYSRTLHLRIWNITWHQQEKMSRMMIDYFHRPMFWMCDLLSILSDVSIASSDCCWQHCCS